VKESPLVDPKAALPQKSDGSASHPYLGIFDGRFRAVVRQHLS
jgi:hypothetical protein